MCLYLETATRRVGVSKYKHKSIRYGTTSWALKQKLKLNPRIDGQINKTLYNWIMHHTKVVQSQIVNDCLKVKIDGRTEQQLVPKLLLQVYVREIHTNLVGDTDNGGIKEARDE